MTASRDTQKIEMLLMKMGLYHATKITDTLQGSIWRANNRTQSSVIKVTDRLMHKQKIAVFGGNQYPVDENVVLEQAILKYLTQSETCPLSIVKFKRFVKSATDYVLEMQDGGSSLFTFILKAHKLIKAGDIEIANWHKVIRVIWKQMIDALEYIHSKNVCHFDISLENFLINEVKIQVCEPLDDSHQKIEILTSSIQVKLCDFGLAQLFTASQKCKSSKFCGKSSYKSPEVANRMKGYNPKKNDIWCLGVCLFMMTFGTAPFSAAKESDDAFRFMMSGNMVQLLSGWKVLHYASQDLIDLIDAIFQYESNRICLSKIKRHPWTQH